MRTRPGGGSHCVDDVLTRRQSEERPIVSELDAKNAPGHAKQTRAANIVMHIARHSFGNIAGDKVSPQMLQKLYRHTSINTTIGYQGNFIHKDADDALDSVLNF